MESKRQKTQHRKESDSKEEESPVPLDSTISSDVWKDLIFPFVGPGNFRFLGAVNKQFRSLYLEMYSKCTTKYDQIYTVEQAQLFCQDIQNEGLPNTLQKEQHQLSSCKVMARLGRQEILEYFLAHDFAMDEKTCTAAAQGGHLKLLQWLHERECSWYPFDICYYAAANGDIPMLQWMHEIDCLWEGQACSSAATHGHLNVLQWLRCELKCRWTASICSDAAENGHLHVIQWAHSEGCPWDCCTLRSAIENGHFDVLVFALDHDCPTDNENLCYYAASSGHLEILQYLHTRGGFNLSESIMAIAARHISLEMVQWLYSVNCPWDSWTCANAASAGNLEMLQWLRARDCPWDEEVYYFAGRYNYENILQWAHENGCPEGDI